MNTNNSKKSSIGHYNLTRMIQQAHAESVEMMEAETRRIRTKFIRLVLIVVIAFAAWSTLACGTINPENIVIGAHTNVENAVSNWATDTCPKHADGTCKLMGE